MKKNKPAHWQLFLFSLLKEEFRLKTDREYPKDAGAAIHTGKPWKSSSLKTPICHLNSLRSRPLQGTGRAASGEA